jgi:hypothetical protein
MATVADVMLVTYKTLGRVASPNAGPAGPAEVSRDNNNATPINFFGRVSMGPFPDAEVSFDTHTSVKATRVAVHSE